MRIPKSSNIQYCALCRNNEANKKNTHYLTDGIIKSCLNEAGSSTREKGLYFDISSNTHFTRMNFQRATSRETLIKQLGRDLTDAEIKEAYKKPYSVDYVFCNHCEDIFSEIEPEFIKDILPKFRNNPKLIDGENEIKDIKLARLFFMIQIWRTAVCIPQFQIEQKTLNKMRAQILNYKHVTIEELKKIPISVNYLKTEGPNGEEEYTSNLVGYSLEEDNKLIFFNDFQIKLHTDINSLPSNSSLKVKNRFGLENIINLNEDTFKINVISNDNRLAFLGSLVKTEKVQPTLNYHLNLFIDYWESLFHKSPSKEIQQEYINELFDYDDLPEAQTLSHERVRGLIAKFVHRRINP